MKTPTAFPSRRSRRRTRARVATPRPPKWAHSGHKRAKNGCRSSAGSRPIRPRSSWKRATSATAVHGSPRRGVAWGTGGPRLRSGRPEQEKAPNAGLLLPTVSGRASSEKSLNAGGGRSRPWGGCVLREDGRRPKPFDGQVDAEPQLPNELRDGRQEPSEEDAVVGAVTGDVADWVVQNRLEEKKRCDRGDEGDEERIPAAREIRLVEVTCVYSFRRAARCSL
jgi:hypothetical protein